MTGQSKNPPSNKRLTFKQGVTDFWDWYQQVGARFFETIEAGDCAKLTDETVDFMDQHLPHLSWVFGAGEGGGHSFTVSGEGQVAKQLLAADWASRAVELPGWTFHSSRQPCTADQLKGFKIGVADQEYVDSDSFQIQSDVDDEAQMVHIVAWHPALERVPPEHHFQILFLLLDEALGEFGTQTWIGEIKIQPIATGVQTRSLTDLPDYIDQVNRYHNWEKLPPSQSYSLYEVNEQRDGSRGDTLVGTSVIANIVGRYIHHQGKLPEDPLEGTGARLAYVAIDGAIFPAGKQSDVRGNIEDAIDTAIQEQWSGRTLGGAFGLKESYIDLLLLDGENSEAIVTKTLNDLQLAGRSRIEYFA